MNIRIIGGPFLRKAERMPKSYKLNVFALIIEQYFAFFVRHIFICSIQHMRKEMDQQYEQFILMLLSKEYIVKMPKKYRKVMYIYAAYNQTFFFLAQRQLKQDCVAHVDLKGRILFQFTFQRPVETCGMLSDRQAIVLETRSNSITIFDLETYKFQRYPHHFMHEEADQSNIIAFSDTKLLCLEEKSRYGDHRYKLSYYYYPFQKSALNRPFVVYESKDQQWTIEYQTMKANNSSMVAWWKPLKDNGIHFFSFDTRHMSKGTLNQYRISLQSIFSCLGFHNFSQKMQIGTTHIWQISKTIFMIISIVSVGNIQKKYHFTRYLIYDSDTFSVQQAKFSFGLNQDYVINCYNLGRSSMFLTYNQQEGHLNSSTIYYVDHKSQAIAAESIWECNCNTFHEFPGYQSGMICESYHELEQVQKFDMTIRKLITPKEMYVYVMLESHPHMDEDLVLDVLKILQDCQHYQ